MKKSPEKNVNLEQENAVLLEQVALLRVELEGQKAIIENLTQENENLISENETLRSELKWIKDQLIISRKKQFGSSSERVHGQISLFGDEFEPKQAKVIEIGPYIRKKRQTTLDTLPTDVEIEVIECMLPEEEQICPQCNGPMQVIGKSLARREIVFKPATMQMREYYQYAYACRNCEENDIKTPVITGKVPNAVIKGGNASPEAIAYIMIMKFLMHIPLHRLEMYWRRMGITISRQTMSGWIIKAAEEWLQRIYERLKALLLEQDVIHADETKIRVLKSEGNGYIWIYRTGKYTEYPIVLMEYQPGRSGEYAKAFFEGREGVYLMTDGYAVYNGVPDTFVRLCCWSHCRRYWLEGLEVVPKKERENSKAYIGFNYCNRIFVIEKELAELTAEERYEKRLELEKPILDEFIDWVKGLHVGKSALGKAVNYTINQWEHLCNYLNDGRLVIHNNLAELGARVVAQGRKNYLFCNTERGARAAAMMYTIIETAKSQNMNPYEYINFIFTDMPNSNRPVDDYLPGSEYLPEICYITKPHESKNELAVQG